MEDAKGEALITIYRVLLFFLMQFFDLQFLFLFFYFSVFLRWLEIIVTDLVVHFDLFSLFVYEIIFSNMLNFGDSEWFEY